MTPDELLESWVVDGVDVTTLMSDEINQVIDEFVWLPVSDRVVMQPRSEIISVVEEVIPLFRGGVQVPWHLATAHSTTSS